MEANRACNNLAITYSILLIGAFFFAMRSCEYSRVLSRVRTKLLQRRDISFTGDTHKVIPHSDPSLGQRSTYVPIQCRNQKNGHNIDKQSIARTSNPILCPILAWANIIGHLAKERMPPSTAVNYVNLSNDPKRPTPQYISLHDTIATLRSSIQANPTLFPNTQPTKSTPIRSDQAQQQHYTCPAATQQPSSTLAGGAQTHY
jgi:hypothetical protein